MTIKIHYAARYEEQLPRSVMGIDDFAIIILDQSVQKIEVCPAENEEPSWPSTSGTREGYDGS